MLKRLCLAVYLVWLALMPSPALAAMPPLMSASPPEELLPWARFDPAIPTPEEVTGVVPGSRPLRHGELLRFFAALAAASPRAELLTYGHSHEGRQMIYLAIGDDKTIAELDAFQSGHARLADPRGRAVAEDQKTIASAKAVA